MLTQAALALQHDTGCAREGGLPERAIESASLQAASSATSCFCTGSAASATGSRSAVRSRWLPLLLSSAPPAAPFCDNICALTAPSNSDTAPAAPSCGSLRALALPFSSRGSSAVPLSGSCNVLGRAPFRTGLIGFDGPRKLAELWACRPGFKAARLLFAVGCCCCCWDGRDACSASMCPVRLAEVASLADAKLDAESVPAGACRESLRTASSRIGILRLCASAWNK